MSQRIQKKSASALLAKFKANQCTPEEIAWLESWYMNWNAENEPELSELELKAVEIEMSEALGLTKRATLKLWPKIAAAASVLFFLSFAFYFFYLQPKAEQKLAHITDLSPGGNRAVLILADGSRIDLKDAKSGALAKEGNVLIKKSKDGQLIYDLSGTVAIKGSEIAYNTIETPRSGTYQVILPDGSSVWLNAASKLKFPTRFAGDERKVEIKGEAYFEVVKNPVKPFRVLSDHQLIEVLGTHFNVNNYTDEPFVKTTLLEGSIKVSSKGSSKIIKPGEQSIIGSGDEIEIVSVNTEQVVAWKNGLFSFKRADLETVMRQIARWYNVEVTYEGEVPEISFTGKIYRNVNLQEALKSIGYMGIKYRVEKNRIIIEPEKQ
jgi:transmembrane sensor